MLNKIQSNKKNYAKYALIIPALAAFIYVFQVNVIAQEKSISVVSHSETNDEIVLLIDKNSTDEQLKKETTVFKEKQGILLKISKITRNSKQEITGIKIEFDDKKGNKGINEVNGDKPIQPITFVKTIDENGKSQIGFNTNKSGSEDESVYTYSYSNSEDAPEPPTPPTPPTAPDYSKIPVPTVKMPAMPKPPRVPSNLNDEKAMKKFDQDMAAFDKKMEKLQPQISNFEKEMEKYQSEMDALNPDMEKFDKEMEKFDIEMEKFDKKMAEYQDQMQTQNMEVEKTIVKSNKKIKK